MIEHAHAHILSKPWGVMDLRPWSHVEHDGTAIGEIWFERAGAATVAPSLLLKLLFTSQPLSIQVHPDDAYAQSIGLRNGKTEAWHVLSAAPEAKIALGLKHRLTAQQMRQAIDDGSISNLVDWQAAASGDSILVPAGTIHAIGAGLVIAEIQQRGDTTFRLFDYGRQRELHIDCAVAVADAGPAHFQVLPSRLTGERTLLVSSPYFVMERIELAPDSAWRLENERETWLLLLSGDARIGSFDTTLGDAIFMQADRVDIHPGPTGLVGLVAYTGVGSVPNLLQRLQQPEAVRRRPPQAVKAPSFLPQAKGASARPELFQ